MSELAEGGDLASLREEIKAGVILLTALILLSGLIILIGGGRFFEKLDKYYVKVMDAAGLEEGAQVKLGGVRVGRVLSITGPHGAGQPIAVEIGLKKGTVLYKGTQALITQSGFVGDVYLLLSVERTMNERIPVGETIPSEEQVQLSRVLANVKDLSTSIEGVIKDVHELFSEKNVKGIEKVIENTNQTIVSVSSSLDQIASALKDTTGKLELVLNEVGSFVKENKGDFSQVMQKAKATLEKAEEDMEKAGAMIAAFEDTAKTLRSTVSGTSKSVDDTLLSVGNTFRSADKTFVSAEKTLSSADKALSSIDTTIKSFDKVVGQQSENLEQLLYLMARTTEDLRDLILEIKAKPWGFIRKEGKPKEE